MIAFADEELAKRLVDPPVVVLNLDYDREAPIDFAVIRNPSIKQYLLNDEGVVTNGNRHEIWKGKNGLRFTVKTAEKEGRWYKAIDIIMATDGHGEPLVFNGETFATEDEAIRAGMNEAITWFKNTLRNGGGTATYRKVLSELEEKVGTMLFW